jgi:hypothetical protein
MRAVNQQETEQYVKAPETRGPKQKTNTQPPPLHYKKMKHL